MLPIITGLFGKMFSDWRLIVIVGLIVAGGYMTVRLKIQESNLQKAQATLQISEANNATLKTNITTITRVNKENEQLIQQMKTDQAITAKAVAQLNNTLSARERTVADMKQKLNGISGVPATKPTPYIDLAVRGIQQLRNEAAIEGAVK